jgi:hypothetical protein
VAPLLLALLLCLEGSAAWGANLVGLGYLLNWDYKVDRKESETTRTWNLKQELGVKYRGFLSPVIENELILKVEQDRDQSGKDIIRVNPTIALGYKSSYWAAGVKRNVEESNEPDRNPKTTDSYFLELFVKPPRPTLPDLKAKYNLDQDYEKDTTDTSKHALVASTVYGPMDWLQIKVDYNLNYLYDNLNPDADTQDDKLTGLAGVRFALGNAVRFVSEYKAEESKGWTKLDAGGRTNNKKDTDQTWKNALSFRPFADSTIDGTYDYDLKQNKANGEDTITENLKVAAAQGAGPFLLKGDFTRAVTDLKNTLAGDDNRKTEDTWTAELIGKPNKFFVFSLKYQDKTTDEVHQVSSNSLSSGSKIYSGSWTGDIAPFWLASATFDRTDTRGSSGGKITVDTIDLKYNIRNTFEFKAINLILEPIYEVTSRDDKLKDGDPSQPGIQPETSILRDFRFRLTYKLVPTSKIAGLLNHTYGRKTDSLLQNVQRTDDTSLNVVWKAPVNGWNLAFDVTRTATDTSGDDLPSDVNTSFVLKGDYRGELLAFATSYKYDMKTISDDSETFDAKVGWLTQRWDLTLTYTFTKTFSASLNEAYSLSLMFKYIIN